MWKTIEQGWLRLNISTSQDQAQTSWHLPIYKGKLIRLRVKAHTKDTKQIYILFKMSSL